MVSGLLGHLNGIAVCAVLVCSVNHGRFVHHTSMLGSVTEELLLKCELGMWAPAFSPPICCHIETAYFKSRLRERLRHGCG